MQLYCAAMPTLRARAVHVELSPRPASCKPRDRWLAESRHHHAVVRDGKERLLGLRRAARLKTSIPSAAARSERRTRSALRASRRGHSEKLDARTSLSRTVLTPEGEGDCKVFIVRIALRGLSGLLMTKSSRVPSSVFKAERMSRQWIGDATREGDGVRDWIRPRAGQTPTMPKNG